MPTSIPQSIRNAWGEEATEDFERWFDEAIQDRAVPRDEYREVLSRLDVLEGRLDGLETRMDGLETDIADVRSDLRALRTEINERFDRMNERFDQMYDRILVMTRWTVGTIALFGTLITVLIAVAEFST